MLVGLSIHQVYLATGFTDMRKSINGLSLIVSEQLGQTLLPVVFLFFVIALAISLKSCIGSVMGFGCIIGAWIRASFIGRRLQNYLEKHRNKISQK
jgi:hypothetical protein